MLSALSKWLEATPLSETIQNVSWVIPLVQTIHILCLAIVLSSVGMMDLRLMGLGGKRVSISGMARRFLPWVWGAVVLMAITGSILIIGEPKRSLLNSAFQLKMILLATVVVITIAFQTIVRRNADFWDASEGRRISARLTAVVSLALWVGIAVCGRLIAYVDVDI